MTYILSLVILATLLGCNPDRSVNPDGQFSIEIQKPTKAFKINKACELILNATDMQNNKQMITAIYDASELKVEYLNGYLAPNSSALYPLSQGDNLFYITGKITGDFKLAFKVTDDNATRTVETTITVQTKVLSMVNTDPNKHFIISKRSFADWNILEDGEIKRSGKYKVSAKVMQGKGVVQVGGEVVWNDTVPDFQPITRPEMSYNHGGMYTGLKHGENVVEYTITDSEGNTSLCTMPYIVDSTKFSPVIFPLSDTISFGRGLTKVEFYLKPIEFVEASYHIRLEGFGDAIMMATNLSGDTIYSNKGGELPVHPAVPEGTTFLAAGFNLTPKAGDLRRYEGNIIIADNWGTEYKFPYSQYLPSPKATFKSMKMFPDVADMTYENSPFTLNLALENYDMGYKPSGWQIMFTPGQNCEGSQPLYNMEPVEWNKKIAADFTEGQPSNHRNMNYFMLFGPNAGEHTWTITVYDNKGGIYSTTQKATCFENKLTLKFTSPEEQTLKFGVDPHASFMYGLSLLRDSYDRLKRYDLTVTSDKSGIITLPPAIQSVPNGQTVPLEASINPLVRYAPSEAGVHTLTVTAKISDGRIVTKKVKVNVLHDATKVTLTTSGVMIKEGEPYVLNVRLSQANFTGQFKYKFELISGQGQLSYNGAPISANTFYQSPKATDGVCVFKLDYDCKGYTGTAQVKITAIGADNRVGNGNTLPFTIQQTIPTITAIVDYSSGTADTRPDYVIGKNAVIKIKVNKDSYVGDLKVTYELVNMAPFLGKGTFDRANNLSLKNGEYIYTYTGTDVYGDTKIKFTVTDAYGRSNSTFATFYFNPILVDVLDLVRIGGDDVYVYTPKYNSDVNISAQTTVTMQFTINEIGYNGQFTVWFESNNPENDNGFSGSKTECRLNNTIIKPGDMITQSKGTHTFTAKSLLPEGDWRTVTDIPTFYVSDGKITRTFVVQF